MPLVPEESSDDDRSSGSSSSSEEDDAGSFDFLSSLGENPKLRAAAPKAARGLASAKVSFVKEPEREPEQVPSEDEEDEYDTAVGSGAAATLDRQRSSTDDLSPEKVSARFGALAERYVQDHSTGMVRAAEATCRGLQERVAQRLSAMLGQELAHAEAGKLVEEARKRLDALCVEFRAEATWAKHTGLLQAGIAADNAAQLGVIEDAATAEASKTARRTRLESQSKLERTDQVASQRSFVAVQSIQRTASELKESIDDQIKDEFKAAAYAAERAIAEDQKHADDEKKNRRSAIESEEAAKMMKRKTNVITDRVKQQREHLKVLNAKIEKIEAEIAAFEKRVAALSGIKNLGSATFEDKMRSQHQR